VDDHALGRSTLSLWLRHWGFHVDDAEDGEQALMLLRAAANGGQPFDVVVLDAVMP
jgi:CheY-like chemotaxis protein